MKVGLEHFRKAIIFSPTKPLSEQIWRVCRDHLSIEDEKIVLFTGNVSSDKRCEMFKHAQINVRTWDKIKDPEVIVHFLMQKYPKIIEEFYRIKASENSEILISELGRKKGFLVKGNEVDKDRTSRLILRDFQEGRIKV